MFSDVTKLKKLQNWSYNIENLCENEYKGYCLNGDWYYLLDEDIVALGVIGKTFSSETKNFLL